jgi:hypothetical protein
MPEPATLPLPEKPSIAVLPFANMSGDPEQEYFADGMVEEIITSLSGIRWLFMIVRNVVGHADRQRVCARQLGAAFAALWLCPRLAHSRDDEHVRHDVLGPALDLLRDTARVKVPLADCGKRQSGGPHPSERRPPHA